ncbi:MAG: 4-hydroxybenzoate octaprenyltransferase [Nitrospiraceae bacterium]
MTSNHSSADRPDPPFTWSAAADLIRLRNQSGTWLLLLPSLWSLVLANQGLPPVSLVSTFVAGAFVMRSLGVVFNDLADRNFDRQVSRTLTRPLASGRLSVRQALIIAAVLLVIAGGLVLRLNPLTIWLSPIAVALAACYPLMKRWIHLPQAMLGVAFGWGAIMAWAASRDTVELPAWLLFGATVCWAVAYDTIYALQDRDDDRRVGVKSSAPWFGNHVPMAVALCLTGMLGCLVFAGLVSGLAAANADMRCCSFRRVSSPYSSRNAKRPLIAPEALAMFYQHIYAGAAILVGLWLGSIAAVG